MRIAECVEIHPSKCKGRENDHARISRPFENFLRAPIKLPDVCNRGVCFSCGWVVGLLHGELPTGWFGVAALLFCWFFCLPVAVLMTYQALDDRRLFWQEGETIFFRSPVWVRRRVEVSISDIEDVCLGPVCLGENGGASLVLKLSRPISPSQIIGGISKKQPENELAIFSLSNGTFPPTEIAHKLRSVINQRTK